MRSSGPLLLGISGPSSSGKTTLSRLLRDILPSAFIIHLDDFFLPDSQIPLRDGLQDWDCIGALNLDSLKSTLEYIREHGKPPLDLASQEDQNAVGESGVTDEEVERWKEHVKNAMKEAGWDESRKVAIIDGFLLFSEDMKEIRELFDVKLFLTTSYAIAKKRREARMGYVTIEGFWEDPPGYVDKIVWPNYVNDHKFLFKDGNVDGPLDGVVCDKIGVKGMPKEAQESMKICLEWAIGILEEVIRGKS